MFAQSLKKQQKLRLLVRQIGDVTGKHCLLLTNGDNNGALNWHFRAHGGEWTWMEFQEDSIHEIEQLMDEPVLLGSPERLPVRDQSFGVVVCIDVHEHLADCRPLNIELHRVLEPGGRVVVTTPNGAAWKPAVLLKNLVGMTKEKYGHTVIGYTIRQHRRMLAEAGLVPIAAGTYSRTATEVLELGINFAYVMVLARTKRVHVKEGTVAPTTAGQREAVERQYRFYSRVYPLLRAVSALDALDPTAGYAVSVMCERPR